MLLKMPGQGFWLFLLVSISVPATFCRHDYMYYISKYHTDTATTQSLKSGTATTSTASTSTTEDSSSEENGFPFKGNQGKGEFLNETILQGNPYNNDIQALFMARIGIIVGSVIVFVVVLGCVVCCCPKCCRGQERHGIILSNNRGEPAVEAAIHPQQPLVPPQHPGVVQQQFPPRYDQERMQQYPASYQQQQYPASSYQQQQMSPHQQPSQECYYPPSQSQEAQANAMQFYNPPEAPPPYENKPQYRY